MQTYFEDPWVKERERRHSIEREVEIKESELYKSRKPPPLFYGMCNYVISKVMGLPVIVTRNYKYILKKEIINSCVVILNLNMFYCTKIFGITSTGTYTFLARALCRIFLYSNA